MPETRNETGKRTATPAPDELALIDAIALDEGAKEVAHGETDISCRDRLSVFTSFPRVRTSSSPEPSVAASNPPLPHTALAAASHAEACGGSRSCGPRALTCGPGGVHRLDSAAYPHRACGSMPRTAGGPGSKIDPFTNIRKGRKTMTRRLIVAIAVSASLAAGFSGSALGDNSFGQHVAMCSHTTLGQRANPPSVTCTHDGTTMTFANFGEMVQHMRAM